MIDMSNISWMQIPEQSQGGFSMGPEELAQQSSYPPNEYEDYTMPAPQPFPFPEQWQQASDIYGNLGQGAPFSTDQWGMSQNALSQLAQGGSPFSTSQFGVGANQLAQLAQGGMPVDVSALGTQMMPGLQRMMEDFQKQGAEGAGMSGTRWSSPFARSLTEFGGKLSENFGTYMAQQNIQAQEAARQRQLGALGQLGQRGGMDLQSQQAARQMQLGALGQFGQRGQADLAAQAANRQLQMGAASGLGGLGSDYLYAPANISQQMMGMGGQMQGQQQAQINAMMNNPYLAQLIQAMSSQQNQYMPEEYKPGWASQFLNLSSSLAPYADWGGGGEDVSDADIATDSQSYGGTWDLPAPK